MKKALLLLPLLFGCIDKEETTVIEGPPSDVTGVYLVSWAGRDGTGEITPAVIAFPNCPCSADSIGGKYTYIDGNLEAELKTIGTDVKLNINGSFASDGGFSGVYEVFVLGSLCDTGNILMRPVTR